MPKDRQARGKVKDSGVLKWSVAGIRAKSFRMLSAGCRVLALVSKRGHMGVSYPAEWQYQFRAAARAAIPKLRRDHGYWTSVWRIYGKRPTR